MLIMEKLLLPERLNLTNEKDDELRNKLEKLKGVKVYKYQNNNDYLANVIDGEVYFSSPVNFNDILDCNLELSQEKIDRSNIYKLLSDKTKNYRCNNSDNDNTQGNYNFEDIVYEIKHRNKILCLTEHNPLSFSSHQMWGLYAGTGAGFVAEYDLKDLLFSLLADVDYTYNVDRMEINEFDLVNKHEYNIEVQSVKYKDKYDPLENIEYCFNSDKGRYLLYYMTKDILWNHEKELRIVASHKHANKSIWLLNKGIKIKAIRPSAIYFGWHHKLCEKLKPEIDVKFIKLLNTLNYDKGEFEYKELN